MQMDAKSSRRRSAERKTTVKTAIELGITKEEYRVLPKVRALLLKRSTVHDMDEKCPAEHGFNMAVDVRIKECGTTRCIGGWMHYFMYAARDLTPPCTAGIYVVSRRSIALHPLFMPLEDANRDRMLDKSGEPYEFDWKLITNKQAVQAIDNFMLTGNPDWVSILGLQNVGDTSLPEAELVQ
jgi:hypothetical protein